MPENEAPEWALAAFARQLAGIARTEPAVPLSRGKPINDTNEKTPASPQESDMPSPALLPQLQPNAPSDLVSSPTATTIPKALAKRELATYDELAELILRTVRTIDECPEQGFIVTAYGSNPWSAMLTIRPEAGPITDAPLWYARAREIGIQIAIALT